MKKVVVTKKSLRSMVRETLFNKGMSGWSANEEGPVTVNPVTDPSAPVTDPINPSFTPQSKTEFGIAVNQLVKNLPDNQMPALYGAVKDAIDAKEDKEDKDEMDKKAAAGGTGNVEEAVRTAVRKVIKEAQPKKFGPVVGDLPPVKKIPAGVHGGEWTRRDDKNKADLKKWLPKAAATIDAPVVEPEEAGPEAGGEEGDQGASTKAYKATAIGGMSDVNYDTEKGEHKPASFQEIAKELGFSVAGAKQAVDKALEKSKFLSQDMDADDLEILTLTAMNDYIKMLSKGMGIDDGEEPLTAADVQLMKDHPDIVRELDGFREFLHNAIRRARKSDQKVMNPVKDEPAAANLPDDDEDKVAEGDDLDETEIALKPVGPDGKPVEGGHDVHHGKSIGKGGNIDIDFGEVPHAGHNKPVSAIHGDDIDVDWNGLDESSRPTLRLVKTTRK